MMNDSCDAVLAELDRISDVPRYLELRRRLGEVNVATDDDFQYMYRTYWRMNIARLRDPFYPRYFARLETLKGGEIVDVEAAIRELAVISDTPARPSLQFSFATKLLNTADPRTPVYDSHVAAFYFFVPPTSLQPVGERLDSLLSFYAFLRAEYARVIDGGLLRVAIDRFRDHFAVATALCDERVVDLLIWGFVSLLQDGAQQRGQALYR